MVQQLEGLGLRRSGGGIAESKYEPSTLAKSNKLTGVSDTWDRLKLPCPSLLEEILNYGSLVNRQWTTQGIVNLGVRFDAQAAIHGCLDVDRVHRMRSRESVLLRMASSGNAMKPGKLDRFAFSPAITAPMCGKSLR
jgi:hypothetical protein